MAYLATTRSGQSYVVAVLAENPSEPINEATAAPVKLSAVKGAFALAAQKGHPARPAPGPTAMPRGPAPARSAAGDASGRAVAARPPAAARPQTAPELCGRGA